MTSPSEMNSAADIVALLRQRDGQTFDGEIHLSSEEGARISAIVEGLEKDLAAQIAGHQETARQSTENLMRANTAQAKIDEAEGRARKHWQAFRDLRLDITGHGPMCRDCADENGRCPHSGRPCDPDEAVREQIAEWRALSRLSEEVAAAIGLTRWMDPPDGGSVSLAEQVRRMRTDLAAAEATILSLKKRVETTEEALTPSAETKAAYIGEFHFNYTVWDPHGEEEITHRIAVPWTSIKEIMAAISARALLHPSEPGGDQ